MHERHFIPAVLEIVCSRQPKIRLSRAGRSASREAGRRLHALQRRTRKAISTHSAQGSSSRLWTILICARAARRRRGAADEIGSWCSLAGANRRVHRIAHISCSLPSCLLAGARSSSPTGEAQQAALPIQLPVAVAIAVAAD